MKYFYTYVLRSLKDYNFYIGFTEDLKKRINEHNTGRVTSTKFRRPFELVYFEGSRCKADAIHREKYLKTTYGKRYLHKRVKFDLAEKVFNRASMAKKKIC